MNNPIRILLVDDSPYFIEAARDFLRLQKTMSVAGVAANAEEAVARARDLQPDIILLDLNLARSSGLDLIPVFKENLPGAKIVVLTMMEETSYYRAAALQAGADDFVPKRDMGNRLVTVIHNLMGRSELALAPTHAEESKRLGERFFQFILEDISELIVRFLPDGTLTYVNDAYCRYYGKTHEELIGSNFISSAVDDFPQKLRAHLQSFTPDQPVIAFEQYDVLPNGEKRWREWVDRAFFDQDGRVLEFQSTGRDITERKRAEEELRAAEEKYRNIFEHAMEAITQTTPEGRYITANPAAARILGYDSPDDLISTVNDLDHQFYVQPGRRQEFKTLMEKHGAVSGFESEVYRREGATIWILENSQAIRDERGNLLYYEGTAQDITERKRAEERIQNQLNRLSALREIDLAITSTFDMRVSLAVLLSQTVKYLSVDAAAVLLVDASMGALNYEAGIGFRTDAPRSTYIKLGESYAGKAALEQRMVRIPNLADELENLLLAAHLKGEDFVSYHAMPLIVKGKVLGVLEVFDRSAAKRDAEWYDFFGSLAGQAAIAVDNAQLFSASQRELMERRRAEEELRQLNAELEKRVEDRITDLKRLNLELERAVRVQDEFLANMSHELRTPLNAIIGLSESLAEKTVGELNEKQAKYLGVIAESGQHLLTLINDILDLAKIEAGQVNLHRDKVDVSAVCRSGLRMIHQLAHKKNQEVSFEMDEDLGLIRADERRLKQMLVNLLSNAVKFTPEGGRLGLEVRGNRQSNIVQFTVWDTGIGIEEEDRERLFHPFVQLDSELSRKTTGTGLGLALVAQMARLHGGSVSVESQPGNGSRFTITLPWETAVNTGSLPRRTTEGLSAGKPGTEGTRRTILLVEDTEDVIVLIGDYLEHAGYKVEIARNGLDGIAQARKMRPDLILMDIQMLDMDGLEATRRLRAEAGFERTPIIALTALALPGDRDRALAAGMDEHISKPVNLKSMLKVIQRFLAGGENPGE